MSSQSTDMNPHNADDSIVQEFEEERRKKFVLVAFVLVALLAASIGILYYFGAMSAAW